MTFRLREPHVQELVVSGVWGSGLRVRGNSIREGRNDSADRSTSRGVAVCGVWSRACACQDAQGAAVSHAAGGSQSGLAGTACRQSVVSGMPGHSASGGLVCQAQEALHEGVRAVCRGVVRLHDADGHRLFSGDQLGHGPRHLENNSVSYFWWVQGCADSISRTNNFRPSLMTGFITSIPGCSGGWKFCIHRSRSQDHKTQQQGVRRLLQRQAVVDSEHQIIVAAEATAAANDKQQAVPLAKAALENAAAASANFSCEAWN